MLLGNTVYCLKLSDEDLSRYNLLCLRKCPCYHYLTEKVMSQEQTFLRACRTLWRENIWHRYVKKKLRRCHTMCIGVELEAIGAVSVSKFLALRAISGLGTAPPPRTLVPATRHV